MPDTKELRQAVLDAGVGMYAVLDGAQFDDLPSALFDGNFAFRPLYLDRGNGPQDQLRTAPQMVWLDHDQTGSNISENVAPTGVKDFVLDRLLALVGDRHAVVFWQCKAGGEALYRHLRGLNMVFIPSDETVDGDESQEQEHAEDLESGEPRPANTGPQLVLFRHADSNVLAQVMPALDEAQFARFFGPANLIAFAPDPEWASEEGFLIAPRLDDLPQAPAGPLRLDRAVMESMDELRVQSRRKSIKAYLNDVAPELTANADKTEIENYIISAEKSALRLNIKTDRGIALWTFTLLLTGGAAMSDPDINRAFLDGRLSGDRVLDEMAEQIIRSEDDSSTWGGV